MVATPAASNTNMQGYMEIRTKRKLLKSTKKFWFVLSQEHLEYYRHKEDAKTGLGPVGQIALSEVVDVNIPQEHRNTIALVRGD